MIDRRELSTENPEQKATDEIDVTTLKTILGRVGLGAAAMLVAAGVTFGTVAAVETINDIRHMQIHSDVDDFVGGTSGR